MVIIPKSFEFSPALTFECGQCFRFEPVDDDTYRGIAYSKVITLKTVPEGVVISCKQEEYDNLWADFLDMSTDYNAAREHVCINDFMNEAVDFGWGIRLLKQEFWEACCSFIISQCNNIPRIKSIIAKLCTLYGEKLPYGGYAFPSAERLASLDDSDMRIIGAGYRASYIINAARAVASGTLCEDELRKDSYEDAKRKLMTVNGIGEKVACCVLLYGLQKKNAFPIDTWIRRVLNEYFSRDFDPSIFGEYAGIAQQYMFYYRRTMSASASMLNASK